MASDTSELRVFEADPSRVVSVTVGELQDLFEAGTEWGENASHGWSVPNWKDCATVNERTCHDFGGEEGTNGDGYDFACLACGWVGDLTEPNFSPRRSLIPH